MVKSKSQKRQEKAAAQGAEAAAAEAAAAQAASPEAAAPQCAGPRRKLPVTILTGYLGAGKTTLLNYLLREQKEKKLAVIENEVGEVSIDDALVEHKQHEAIAELVVLDNGCVCCSVRDDLVKTLSNIASSGLELDGVLLELTGAADPAPVVQTFFVKDEIRPFFTIDNVVALVDAKHAIRQFDEAKEDPEGKGTALAQIAFSSMVLLNKVDLVDDEELSKIEARVRKLNSTVTIARCENAAVPVNELIDVGAFSLARVLEEQYMEEEEFTEFYQSKMDKSISNVGIRCPGMVAMFHFQQMLDHFLSEEQAVDFMRIKAVLNIAGSDSKFVVQCVHMLKNTGFTVPWGADEVRENRIIFIGRGMQGRRQELTEAFNDCIAAPLRFDVGEKVQVRTQPESYEPGRVKKQWDECNPYRVALSAGGQVHAPCDDDYFIKASD